MIDPVYGSIPFVKRRSQFPADPSIFRQIDYLLISHDHFDHLDKLSVARLVADNPQQSSFVVWIRELWLKAGSQSGSDRSCMVWTVCRWWFPLDVFTCTALEQAWCKRWGERLWGFAIREMVPFTTVVIQDMPGIWKKLPDFLHIDYCMVGIGAYKPRWFMKPNHISPYDALTASADLNAKVTIPMHWRYVWPFRRTLVRSSSCLFAAEAKKRYAGHYSWVREIIVAPIR